MHDFQAPPDLFANRTILVTGASDGIGRAAAISYASLGAQVILLGRSQEKLAAVYDHIEQAGYPQPAMLPMDLAYATPEQYQQLATMLTSEFGHLDGLLLNAAVLGDITPLEQYEIGTWDHVMATNLRSNFMMIQGLLPVLRLAQQANIIMTTSSVGRQGRAYWGAYAVSKAGIESLCQIWAAELGNTSRIRVNCINPGATRTLMRLHAYPAENPENLRRPEEILSLYHYLMCEASAGVNGTSMDAQPVS